MLRSFQCRTNIVGAAICVCLRMRRPALLLCGRGWVSHLRHRRSSVFGFSQRSTRSLCGARVVGLVVGINRRDGPSVEPSVAAAVSAVAKGMLSEARLTSVAQTIWTAYVQPGDLVVDATAGNGNDTLWLAEAVGANGRVHAFDKEEQALEATRAKIDAEFGLPEVTYHHCCHSLMQDAIELHSASLICFNLGYLPCAEDKNQTVTKQETTVAAVAAALNVVNSRGLISIMAYTGQPGGQTEYEAVRQQLQALSPAEWTVSEHRYLNRPTAPVLMYVAAKDAKSRN